MAKRMALTHVALASPKCPTLDRLLFSLMPDELSVFSSHFGPWTLALGLSHSPGEITLLSSVAIPWPCHLHTCDEANTQLCLHLAPHFFFFFFTWEALVFWIIDILRFQARDTLWISQKKWPLFEEIQTPAGQFLSSGSPPTSHSHLKSQPAGPLPGSA